MTTDETIHRRTVLKRTGAITLASVAVAGCSGDGGDGGNNDDEEDDNGNGGNTDFGGWLDGANNYDGTVEDMTGSDTVTVEVGAGSGLAFGPAAVRISTGTTIEFEWTGSGGGHNVHAQEGAEFESDTYTESGNHFSHTFEETGTVKYQCDPHSSVMKGAVVVE